ncbi:AbfB domain-containing protein [Catellatospora bangladeshensis]|uniref:AbfB domain-containing protein n=1 Tax=Catellatospora bangladeshensis TaxID=310355 RepID=UPI003612393F
MFESELRRMIDQLKGITSIVLWVPFNEGWGEYDPARIADLVKSWDPSRLVTNNSGSNCCGFDGGNGDVIDDHIYVGPGTTALPTATRIAVLGEYGGIGLRVTGHEWSPGNGFAYEMTPDSATLTRRYVEATGQLRNLIDGRGLSASVYTEPTDVENEVNGFFTYDRQIQKMDFAQARAVNLSVLAAAQGSYLPVGQLASLRVTTSGHTTKYLSHSGSPSVTQVVSGTSTDAVKKASTFWVRQGLASASCLSFESRDVPGQFLRHSGYRVQLAPNDGTSLYAADATFCQRAGLAAGGVSLESYNFPGRYLRHINSEVWISNSSGANAWDNPASFAADATWRGSSPWWRSGVDLPLDQARSLQVVTPGYTDRFLAHSAGLGVTSVVNASSSATLKADATFVVRRGLADPTCYSFESRNFAGHYLRHANFRVRKDARDGSALFDADATFCPQAGRYGTGNVSLVSSNLPSLSVRHYAAEVWVAGNGGPHPYDSPAGYAADTTWALVSPGRRSAGTRPTPLIEAPSVLLERRGWSFDQVGDAVTINLCVLLWAHPGAEAALAAYEDKVLALFDDHGCTLLQRARTDGADGAPTEIQLISVPSQAALDAYMTDPRRTTLAAERDAAVARTDIHRVTLV